MKLTFLNMFSKIKNITASDSISTFFQYNKTQKRWNNLESFLVNAKSYSNLISKEEKKLDDQSLSNLLSYYLHKKKLNDDGNNTEGFEIEEGEKKVDKRQEKVVSSISEGIELIKQLRPNIEDFIEAVKEDQYQKLNAFYSVKYRPTVGVLERNTFSKELEKIRDQKVFASNPSAMSKYVYAIEKVSIRQREIDEVKNYLHPFTNVSQYSFFTKQELTLRPSPMDSNIYTAEMNMIVGEYIMSTKAKDKEGFKQMMLKLGRLFYWKSKENIYLTLCRHLATHWRTILGTFVHFFVAACAYTAVSYMVGGEGVSFYKVMAELYMNGKLPMGFATIKSIFFSSLLSTTVQVTKSGFSTLYKYLSGTTDKFWSQTLSDVAPNISRLLRAGLPLAAGAYLAINGIPEIGLVALLGSSLFGAYYIPDHLSIGTLVSKVADCIIYFLTNDYKSFLLLNGESWKKFGTWIYSSSAFTFAQNKFFKPALGATWRGTVKFITKFNLRNLKFLYQRFTERWYEEIEKSPELEETTKLFEKLGIDKKDMTVEEVAQILEKNKLEVNQALSLDVSKNPEFSGSKIYEEVCKVGEKKFDVKNLEIEMLQSRKFTENDPVVAVQKELIYKTLPTDVPKEVYEKKLQLISEISYQKILKDVALGAGILTVGLLLARTDIINVDISFVSEYLPTIFMASQNKLTQMFVDYVVKNPYYRENADFFVYNLIARTLGITTLLTRLTNTLQGINVPQLQKLHKYIGEFTINTATTTQKTLIKQFMNLLVGQKIYKRDELEKMDIRKLVELLEQRKIKISNYDPKLSISDRNYRRNAQNRFIELLIGQQKQNLQNLHKSIISQLFASMATGAMVPVVSSAIKDIVNTQKGLHKSMTNPAFIRETGLNTEQVNAIYDLTKSSMEGSLKNDPLFIAIPGVPKDELLQYAVNSDPSYSEAAQGMQKIDAWIKQLQTQSYASGTNNSPLASLDYATLGAFLNIGSDFSVLFKESSSLVNTESIPNFIGTSTDYDAVRNFLKKDFFATIPLAPKVEFRDLTPKFLDDDVSSTTEKVSEPTAPTSEALHKHLQIQPTIPSDFLEAFGKLSVNPPEPMLTSEAPVEKSLNNVCEGNRNIEALTNGITPAILLQLMDPNKLDEVMTNKEKMQDLYTDPQFKDLMDKILPPEVRKNLEGIDYMPLAQQTIKHFGSNYNDIFDLLRMAGTSGIFNSVVGAQTLTTTVNYVQKWANYGYAGIYAFSGANVAYNTILAYYRVKTAESYKLQGKTDPKNYWLRYSSAPELIASSMKYFEDKVAPLMSYFKKENYLDTYTEKYRQDLLFNLLILLAKKQYTTTISNTQFFIQLAKIFSIGYKPMPRDDSVEDAIAEVTTFTYNAFQKGSYKFNHNLIDANAELGNKIIDRLAPAAAAIAEVAAKPLLGILTPQAHEKLVDNFKTNILKLHFKGKDFIDRSDEYLHSWLEEFFSDRELQFKSPKLFGELDQMVKDALKASPNVVGNRFIDISKLSFDVATETVAEGSKGLVNLVNSAGKKILHPADIDKIAEIEHRTIDNLQKRALDEIFTGSQATKELLNKYTTKDYIPKTDYEKEKERILNLANSVKNREEVEKELNDIDKRKKELDDLLKNLLEDSAEQFLEKTNQASNYVVNTAIPATVEATKTFAQEAPTFAKRTLEEGAKALVHKATLLTPDFSEMNEKLARQNEYLELSKRMRKRGEAKN